MGALLKKQKPMALSGSAWCPGGRTQQNAFAAPPDITLLRAKGRKPSQTKTGLIASAGCCVGHGRGGSCSSRVTVVLFSLERCLVDSVRVELPLSCFPLSACCVS